jgi:flagellar hook-length control protein FliK
MNALASVMPTPAPSAGSAPPRNDENSADPCRFAQCMAHAQQAQAAAGDDDAAADDAPGDAPAEAAASAPDTASDTAATPPDLTALLPGWSAVPAVATAEPSPTGKATAKHEAVPAPDSMTLKAAVAVADASSVAQTAAAPPERGQDFALPLPARDATAVRAPAEPRAATPDNALPSLPAAAAPTAVAAAPARAPDSAAPMAHLPAPIHTPAFAPALATQVRWWAQDGVQQAQLTLNPPEMGPVAVKIVLQDQREARIDFVADVAATRSALEAALPVLAAALDESGLKLTGGGVHDGAAQRQALWQQAQQHPHAARGTAAHGSGQSVTTASAEMGTRAQAARGLVDLVA